MLPKVPDFGNHQSKLFLNDNNEMAVYNLRLTSYEPKIIGL